MKSSACLQSPTDQDWKTLRLNVCCFVYVNPKLTKWCYTRKRDFYVVWLDFMYGPVSHQLFCNGMDNWSCLLFLVAAWQHYHQATFGETAVAFAISLSPTAAFNIILIGVRTVVHGREATLARGCQTTQFLGKDTTCKFVETNSWNVHVINSTHCALFFKCICKDCTAYMHQKFTLDVLGSCQSCDVRCPEFMTVSL